MHIRLFFLFLQRYETYVTQFCVLRVRAIRFNPGKNAPGFRLVHAVTLKYTDFPPGRTVYSKRFTMKFKQFVGFFF